MNLPRSCLALLLCGSFPLLAADPPKDGKEEKSLVITDSNGRLAVPKKWKIVAGPVNVLWTPKPVETFPVREVGSTTFKEGVVTYVPMSRLQSIAYDYEKEMATFNVAGLDKPLQGSTRFVGINTIIVEGEIDRGMGAVDLKFRGGVIKGGFKEIKFPETKAPDAPPAKGELFSFQVVPEGKGKTGTVMTASNVKALYQMGDGKFQLLSWIMLKKTLKVEIATVKKMHLSDYKVSEKTAECDVTLNDGMQLSATLLSSVMIDNKPATLLGFLGDVPAGWKFFPLHTFSDFQPGEMKIEEKKEEPKKKVEPKKVEPKKIELKVEAPAKN